VVQVGKETESCHGVLQGLEVQREVQAKVQVDLLDALEQQVQVQVQGGCLPPNRRHPHLGMVAEADLQVDEVRLEHSVVVQEAAALDAAQAKESRACV
jgi:hypothetical protein